MREIDEFEKRIIDKISLGHTHISVLLVDQIPDLLLKIVNDHINNIFTVNLIFFEYNSNGKIENKAIYQTERIIYIINYLLYLETEGYIVTGYFSHGRTVDPIIGNVKSIKEYKDDSKTKILWDFTDERMVEFIFKYADITIFPTSRLKKFKLNNYKTQDDIKHRQILNLTYIAIVVSLIIGLASFVKK